MISLKEVSCCKITYLAAVFYIEPLMVKTAVQQE